MLLGFVFVVMGITFYQERKTERALDALRDLSSPRALVDPLGPEKRGSPAGRWCGATCSFSPRATGFRPTRSCRHATNLSVDESLLTGESVPGAEVGGPDGLSRRGRPGGDDLPFVYSGTLVVQGQGDRRSPGDRAAHRDRQDRQGARRSLEPEDTPLQRETARLVRLFAIIGLALCALVVAGLRAHPRRLGSRGSSRA